MIHDITVTRDIRNLGRRNAAAIVKRAACDALKAEGVEVPCEIDIMLTDDEHIHEINRQYRNVDRPTDVLSFPMNELEPGAFDAEICEKNPETGKILLGDMVISIPRCEAQGEEFGHGFDREIAYLTVHSVLHLLGYDHVDEGPMKKQMRTREKEIMGDKL